MVFPLFPSSSAVERPAVNRLVVGSSPTSGAPTVRKTYMGRQKIEKGLDFGSVEKVSICESVYNQGGLFSIFRTVPLFILPGLLLRVTY